MLGGIFLFMVKSSVVEKSELRLLISPVTWGYSLELPTFSFARRTPSGAIVTSNVSFEKKSANGSACTVPSYSSRLHSTFIHRSLA